MIASTSNVLPCLSDRKAGGRYINREGHKQYTPRKAHVGQQLVHGVVVLVFFFGYQLCARRKAAELAHGKSGGFVQFADSKGARPPEC